ncbi:MAG: protein kinase [Planctomycetales bacterium]|nr:protein kinase [Planctomycetales bacterium]
MDPRRTSAFGDNAPTFVSLGTKYDGASPQILQPPKMLGPYEVGPELGRGGMGTVYRAVDVTLHRVVALKVLPIAATLRSADTQRFQIEAQAAAQLNHDNIVPIYSVGNEGGTHYYAMKLIEGEDLGRLIHRARSTVRSQADATTSPKKPAESTLASADQEQVELPAAPASSLGNSARRVLSSLSSETYAQSLQRRGGKAAAAQIARTVAEIGVQVAEALEHAHQRGVIHRDIKPSNLILDHANRVWVTDFGLAHLQNSPELTHTGDLIGTLLYMSPEQASGKRELLDHRTDIYSLGVALYELATLSHACRSRKTKDILRELTQERPLPIRKVNPLLPSDLETILCRATERNPADRYDSAAAMAADLRKLAANQAIKTRRTPKWKHARDWLYQRPALVVIMAIFASILISGLALGAWALQIRSVENLGHRLQAESALALLRDRNSSQALKLALEAANYTPGFAADQAVLAALNDLREIHRIDLGTSQVGTLSFSSDGRWLVKGVDSRLVDKPRARALVFDAEQGKLMAELAPASILVQTAFSPDGRYLLSSGAESVPSGRRKLPKGTPVYLWKSNDWNNSPTVISNAMAVRLGDGAFSQATPMVVLPSVEGNEAIVFDSSDWSKVVLRLRGGHTAPVIEALFSPNGNLIATWSEDSTAALWDANSGSKLHAFDYQDGLSPFDVGIEFSSNSKELMIRGSAGIKTYSTATYENTRYMFHRDAAFADRDDRVFAKDTVDGSVVVYSAHSSTEVTRCVTNAQLQHFATVGKDQQVAITTNGNDFIQLYNSADGSLIGECRAHTDWIIDIQARPESSQFATIAWDNTIRIWNSVSDQQRRTIDAGQVRLTNSSIEYSLDAQRALISTITDERSTHWKISESIERRLEHDGKTELILDDGRILVERPGELAVMDPGSLRDLFVLPLPSESIAQAIELRNSNGLLLITDSRQLWHWSLDTLRLVSVSETGDSIVDIAIQLPDERLIAATQNGDLMAYDPLARSRRRLASFESTIGRFDLDERNEKLLIAMSNSRLRIWDIHGESVVNEISSDAFPVYAGFFALGGEYVVTHGLGQNQRMGLWRISDGQVVASIECGPIREIALSHDRRVVAVASKVDGGFVWNLETNDKIQVTANPCSDVKAIGSHFVFATESSYPQGSWPNSRITEAVQESSVILWHQQEQRIFAQEPLGLMFPTITVNESAQSFAVSGTTYGATLVEIESSKMLQKLLGHTGPLLLAAHTAVEGHAILVSVNGMVQLHDLRDGSTQLLGRHDYSLTAANLSPDRKQLVTSDSSGRTSQWDLVEQVKVRDLDAPFAEAFPVEHAIGSDNLQVVSLYAPDAISLWDLRTGLHDIHRFETAVHSISLSPDSPLVLVLAGNRRISVNPSQSYDLLIRPEANQLDAFIVNTDTKVQSLIDLEEEVVAGQFLPAGKLALLTRVGSILIVDAKTLATEHIIQSTSRILGSLAPGGDNCLFVRTKQGYEGWNWVTGQQEFSLRMNLDDFPVYDAHRWSVGMPSSPWLLFRERESIVKIPQNPVHYANQLAPWIRDAQ